MKKHLFLAAVAAFALVSCAKDETKSINTGEEISFRSAMQVKATETTVSNLESFNVTAFFTDDNSTYFEDLTYTNNNLGSFTSNEKYYWPTRALKFVAYSPITMSTQTSTDNVAGTVKLTDFTVNSSIADQVDLIAATATGNKNDNEGVPVSLAFDHLLSQIEVLAKNDNATYTFTISGLKIAQVYSKGTVDLAATSGAWSGASEKAVYEITLDTPVELGTQAKSLMGNVGNAMLIPQTLTPWNIADDPDNSQAGAYLSVLVDIDTEQGVNVYPTTTGSAWAAVPISTQWTKGHHYIYTLDFSAGAGNVDPEDPNNPGDPILGSAITFTVTVNEWTETPSTVDMP